jgi:ATP-dependent RNA helicase DeaD
MTEFESMGLRPELLSSIKSMGFNTPTEVQEEAIPVALQGKDIVVRAKTGTGKTAAFLIPIINSTKKEDYDSSLIIVPTRELALQVTDVARKMSKESGLGVVTIYGGASMNVQINELRRRINIIVGTPGRVIDLIKQRELRTENIKFLILDEADIMFEMGFIEDIEWIISKLPKERQTMLFSATMPSTILAIAKRHMRNAEKINVGKEEEVTVSSISHYYTIANGREKLSTLLAYINQYKPRKAIVFTATQRGADLVFRLLKENGFDATLMHGGLTQARREYSLSDFRKGTQFLIATNVASRGLDITDISDIINFDVSEDVLVYVHRVGRSARMGAEGRAFSIIPYRDKYLVEEIEHSANVKMNKLELDTSAYKNAENIQLPAYTGNRNFGARRGGFGQRGFQRRGQGNRDYHYSENKPTYNQTPEGGGTPWRKQGYSGNNPRRNNNRRPGYKNKFYGRQN